MKKIYFLCLFSLNIQALPLIKSLSWGKIEVEENHQITTYRDCIIWHEGHDIWDWSKTNTHHNPGVQIIDLEAIITKVDEIILTRGMDLILLVPKQTIHYAKNFGKNVHVIQSQEVMNLYNELIVEGKKVGALIHSTC